MAATNIPTGKKLLIILDCTGSMQNSIEGIKKAIFQLFSIGNLCGSNMSIQFVLYRDYCIPRCCKWTTKISPIMTNCYWVSAYINDINAAGGGDAPEASKTAFFKAIDLITEDTIVFFYTDAITHDDLKNTSNGCLEAAEIGDYYFKNPLANRIKTYYFYNQKN